VVAIDVENVERMTTPKKRAEEDEITSPL